MDGAYKLRVKTRSGFETLALANRLAGDPRILWAEPDFVFKPVAGKVGSSTPPSVVWACAIQPAWRTT